MSTAAEFALAKVSRVRDDPDARLALMCRLYTGPGGDGTTHLPYRRAAVAFMRWQLRRELLRPCTVRSQAVRGGGRSTSGCSATDGERALDVGYDPAGSTASASPSLEFIREPTARNWYRAHNASIVAAYLEHRDLAEQESRTERFLINLVLLRVLYAHALVSAPRLALGWLAPVAPALGDLRVRMTGIFLSISRILPHTYPLGDDVERYVTIEHQVGRLLDIGVIQPRLRRSTIGRPPNSAGPVCATCSPTTCHAMRGPRTTAGRGSRAPRAWPGWRGARYHRTGSTSVRSLLSHRAEQVARTVYRRGIPVIR